MERKPLRMHVKLSTTGIVVLSLAMLLLHESFSMVTLTYQGLFPFFPLWCGVFSVLEEAQFAFSVIVKQVLGLSPEDPVTARILEDFLAFMKGLISFPLYIPGTPYAKAVQVIILTCRITAHQ